MELIILRRRWVVLANVPTLVISDLIGVFLIPFASILAVGELRGALYRKVCLFFWSLD